MMKFPTNLNLDMELFVTVQSKNGARNFVTYVTLDPDNLIRVDVRDLPQRTRCFAVS